MKMFGADSLESGTKLVLQLEREARDRQRADENVGTTTNTVIDNSSNSENILNKGFEALKSSHGIHSLVEVHAF